MGLEYSPRADSSARLHKLSSEEIGRPIFISPRRNVTLAAGSRKTIKSSSGNAITHMELYGSEWNFVVIN